MQLQQVLTVVMPNVPSTTTWDKLPSNGDTQLCSKSKPWLFEDLVKRDSTMRDMCVKFIPGVELFESMTSGKQQLILG
jgi:hypothetical protein